MSEVERRELERVSLKIPVKCAPLVSNHPGVGIEIWTRDVHPHGTGLHWLISSKPSVCQVCNSIVKDLNCSQAQCPYRCFRDVLMDCGWVQIEGLNHVPGWENEEKFLGKVIWFQVGDNGADFHFGVRFSRGKPPIRPMAEAVNAPSAPQLHGLDLERWRLIFEEKNKIETV